MHEWFSYIINLFLAVLTGADKSPKDIILAAAYAVLFFLAFVFLRLVLMIVHLMWVRIVNHRVAEDAQRFSANRSGLKRILIVGDSTAYGTGASDPQDSIAGRLAHDFAESDIVNVAVNGSLVSGAVKQLASVADQNFDLIIVSTGGNDIWRLTPIAKIAEAFETLLRRAVEVSNHHVIVLFYANFGLSPAIPRFLRPILQRRTVHMRAVFDRTCKSLNVPLIDLFTKTGLSDSLSNPFQSDPDLYFARDHIHPSSDGYWMWYSHMWNVLVQRGFLFSERDRPPVIDEPDKIGNETTHP